jgi:hypothetical protein
VAKFSSTHNFLENFDGEVKHQTISNKIEPFQTIEK